MKISCDVDKGRKLHELIYVMYNRNSFISSVVNFFPIVSYKKTDIEAQSL